MLATFKQNGSSELQIEVLKAICGDTENKTMVDLACGSAPQTSQIKFKERTFVDIVKRHLPEVEEELINMDVIKYLKKAIEENKQFDISISTDTIEHFRDNDALEFLALTSKVAKKQIWFTPLGEYCMTTDQNDNNPDSHKSEWTPEKLDGIMKGKWAHLVFPNWHPTLGNNGLGAFFSWTCDNIKEDYEIVIDKLKHIL